MAQAYGIKSLRIDQTNDVEMALKEVLNYDGPVLLDVIIPQDENVFPMVPEGASINEMLELKKKKREKENRGGCMRHILSVTVNNQPAVLARISGLFSRRNFNILSLNVGETELPEYSRMTIVVEGNTDTLEQVKKQLYKLIDVIKITELNQSNMIERDMAIIKVNCGKIKEAKLFRWSTFLGVRLSIFPLTQ